MFDIKRKTIDWAGRPLTLETGRIARQADGAVMVSYGDTVVLCTVVANKNTAAKTISNVIKSRTLKLIKSLSVGCCLSHETISISQNSHAKTAFTTLPFTSVNR